MKFKQFYGTGPSRNEVDRNVNDWMESNPNIRVINVKHDIVIVAEEKWHTWGFSVFITYTEVPR